MTTPKVPGLGAEPLDDVRARGLVSAVISAQCVACRHLYGLTDRAWIFICAERISAEMISVQPMVSASLIFMYGENGAATITMFAAIACVVVVAFLPTAAWLLVTRRMLGWHELGSRRITQWRKA